MNKIGVAIKHVVKNKKNRQKRLSPILFLKFNFLETTSNLLYPSLLWPLSYTHQAVSH